MARSAFVFRHQNRVRLRGGTGARGNETARLDDSIERASIDHQVLDQWERFHAERLDSDRLAVAEFAHVDLTGRTGMVWPMRFAIDCH